MHTDHDDEYEQGRGQRGEGDVDVLDVVERAVDGQADVEEAVGLGRAHRAHRLQHGLVCGSGGGARSCGAGRGREGRSRVNQQE